MAGISIHIVPSICLGFFIQLILHETGHLIFGLLTGWRFLFIQINRLALMHVNNKLCLTVVKDKNFRCIMSPKSVNSNALLYTMGGCIANLVSAIFGFIIMIFSCSNPVLWLYLWGFTAFGAGLFLMNGISRTKRICNDKACYDLIKQNNHTGVCHNAQLLIANYLARGFTYGRIGKELLFPCPRTANNDIEVYQAILEYYYYLDTGDYRSAGQALDKIRISQSNSKEISDLVKAEQIYGKLMLFFILGETPVKALTDCDWNKYIKKGDVQALRVKAVIEDRKSVV